MKDEKEELKQIMDNKDNYDCNSLCFRCNRFKDEKEGCVINHETQVPMKYPNIADDFDKCPWYDKLVLEPDNLKIDTSKASQEFADQYKEFIKGTQLSYLVRATSWTRVLNAARRTIGKQPIDKEPSNAWKAKILLAEHSPIRLLEYDFGWDKIRQWVTAHFVRHHEGCEKFVHSQRGDRRKLRCKRDNLPQGEPNDMDMTANAQALINISRKRLCSCASKETREAWKLVIDQLHKIDPILASKCVPECVYRGFCPEWMSSCGFYKTESYKKKLAAYRRTKFDEDVKWYYDKKYNILISNTGHIYDAVNTRIDETFYHEGYYDYLDIEIENDFPYTCKEFDYFIENYNGIEVLCIKNHILHAVPYLVYKYFGEKEYSDLERCKFRYIDGNVWNNDINNIEVVT